jgi:hypothetical protein
MIATHTQAMLAADSTARLAAVGDFSSYSTAKVRNTITSKWFQGKMYKQCSETGCKVNRLRKLAS